MYLHASIYLGSLILVMFGLESIDFNKLLKSHKPAQARIIYIVITFALTELVGQFFINILIFSKLI